MHLVGVSGSLACYRVSCIMVRSTHNARKSTAHGVRLTQQILMHYGCNCNARESVGGSAIVAMVQAAKYGDSDEIAFAAADAAGSAR